MYVRTLQITLSGGWIPPDQFYSRAILSCTIQSLSFTTTTRRRHSSAPNGDACMSPHASTVLLLLRVIRRRDRDPATAIPERAKDFIHQHRTPLHSTTLHYTCALSSPSTTPPPENANLMSHHSVKSRKQRDHSRKGIERFSRQIVCRALSLKPNKLDVGNCWCWNGSIRFHVITITQTYQQTSTEHKDTGKVPFRVMLLQCSPGTVHKAALTSVTTRRCCQYSSTYGC